MLIRTNSSHYMFYFSSDDIEIAGPLPETLTKLQDNNIYTFPLAGTRPRGKNDLDDKKLEKELFFDEKELVKHNILVDLVRNDISKISEFGTIKIEKYLNIEKFFSCNSYWSLLWLENLEKIKIF